MVNKGIILAGGMGTRLYPATKVVSKLLIPIFDKPVIYYPVSVLMKAGIKDILIISSHDQISQFENLLGDGSTVGIRISYEVQEQPEGIAQAFTIGSDFIGDERVALILGDNFFHGGDLSKKLTKGISIQTGAVIFVARVENPSDFGVLETDRNGTPVSLEEKPRFPKSSNAVTGLYVYDSSVIDVVADLSKSERGEYEITDVNVHYMDRGCLSVIQLDDETNWLDIGSQNALLAASNYVSEFQNVHSCLIGSIEATSHEIGLISKSQLFDLIERMPNCYYKYALEKLVLT